MERDQDQNAGRSRRAPVPPPAAGSVLVIGYGNSLRGDDAAGPRVAEAVAELDRPGVEVRTCHQLTPELSVSVAVAERVIFVDAEDRPPGAPVARAIGPEAGAGSGLGHGGDPREILALARLLYGRVPPAWLVSVPASSFELGTGLSPGCAAAIGPAVTLVRELCDDFVAAGADGSAP